MIVTSFRIPQTRYTYAISFCWDWSDHPLGPGRYLLIHETTSCGEGWIWHTRYNWSRHDA